MLSHDAVTRPFQTLIVAFAAWKLFLLLIAAGSSLVSDAYDTSGSLALGLELEDIEPLRPADGKSVAAAGGALFLSRLSSWDAIYFNTNAKRGYLLEQEWAFGSGLPYVVSWLVRGFKILGLGNETQDVSHAVLEPLAGVLVSHAAHLLSALALHQLGWHLWRDARLALVAALLHVLSPAGIFLSAPYNEAPFALLSFVGYLLFAEYYAPTRPAAIRDAAVISAGVLFGLSCLFRSNGILNGIPFAWEFLQAVRSLPSRPGRAVRQLLVLGVGGVCVAAGSIVPQTVAYLHYCRPDTAVAAVENASSSFVPRPWCQRLVPSIYTFVQNHYWGVGFLNYWTPGNVPLFLLAAPMLFVLLKSGTQFLRWHSGQMPGKVSAETDRLKPLVLCMAAGQVLLALLAITNYHIQIITRVSSGYPLWYWWLAQNLIAKQDGQLRLGNGIVVFMVMYASIQGALFTSFLPPA